MDGNNTSKENKNNNERIEENITMSVIPYKNSIDLVEFDHKNKCNKINVKLIFKILGLIILIFLYVFYWLNDDFRSGTIINYEKIL